MKIAIFHNFMDNIGGAEIVGLTLAREFNADFYTTNIDYAKIEKMGFSDIRFTSIGRIPINAPFRQQTALHKFSRLNLGKTYDFYIIDGDWAMSGAQHNKPNLWYVHSPIREIWDLYKYTRENIVPWFGRIPFDIWVSYNRALNKKYIKHVNTIVCNSNNTKNRINKYLNRDAIVINPPIDTHALKYSKNGAFWLSVNRLITHKRIEMQIEAFRQLPNEQLMIVGSYEDSRHFTRYAQYIKSIKPHNVTIRHWVDKNELAALYGRCKGFITTAKEEDFGMTVVEAMSAGKPVIAPNEGGYKESIIHGETGLLIDNIDTQKLIRAIVSIGKNPEQYKDACVVRAQQYDSAIFLEKIKNHMMSVYGSIKK